MRSDFSALALFAPAVKVDAQGHATVQLKLPDNLTRYRVMAVGRGRRAPVRQRRERSLVARLPLMVRPSPAALPELRGPLRGARSCCRTRLMRPLDGADRHARPQHQAGDRPATRVTIPANDRVEVRFPAATEHGRARHASRWPPGACPVAPSAGRGQAASSGRLRGRGRVLAARLHARHHGGLCHLRRARRQRRHGAAREGSSSNVFPQFGGLEIELSSTALQALTDAILYLVRYPFECAEQGVVTGAGSRGPARTSSRPSTPRACRIPRRWPRSVSRDIDKLKTMQNGRRWLRLLAAGRPGVAVSHGPRHQRPGAGEGEGYTVPLRDARPFPRLPAFHRIAHPPLYGPRSRNAIIAYALNVRWRMGDRDVARARKLVQTGLPPSTGQHPSAETLLSGGRGVAAARAGLDCPRGRRRP